MADEEELVCGLAFAKQIPPGIEAMVSRTAGHEPAMLGRKAGKEGMFLQDSLKALHLAPPLPPAELP